MATYKIKGVKKASILYSSGSASPGAEEQIVFTKTVAMDVQQTNIDFLGDNQKQTLFSIDKVVATIDADKFTTSVLEKLYGKSSTPQAGEISRYYMGEEAEELGPDIGLKVELLAIDDTDGTKHTIQIIIYKGRASPYKLPAANSKQLQGMAFIFEGVKTSTDVLGSAIPGVPSDGAYYSIAVLSS